MKKKRYNSAVKSLSSLFGFILLLVAGSIGAIVFFAFTNLPDYSYKVNQKLKQANLIKESDSEESSGAEKSKYYFSTLDNFDLQAKTDVEKYASITGVEILSFSKSPSPEYPNSVSIKLGNTSYVKLVQFLTLLESNLPKLTIHTISLRNSSNPSVDSLTVETLEVSVAI